MNANAAENQGARPWVKSPGLTAACLRASLETSPAERIPALSNRLGLPTAPQRAQTQLHQLKRKLLRFALEETPEMCLYKRLCGVAHQSADLAWDSGEPLLVFPCLFDEMVRTVRNETGSGESISRSGCIADSFIPPSWNGSTIGLEASAEPVRAAGFEQSFQG